MCGHHALTAICRMVESIGDSARTDTGFIWNTCRNSQMQPWLRYMCTVVSIATRIYRFIMRSIKRVLHILSGTEKRKAVLWHHHQKQQQCTCLVCSCRQANKPACVSSLWTSIYQGLQWVCLILHWQNSENQTSIQCFHARYRICVVPVST